MTETSELKMLRDMAGDGSAMKSQVGGFHYRRMAIQPAQYCHANGIGHLAGDAIAYISRYKFKNGREDLEKAIHSLQLLIELEYKNGQSRAAEEVEYKTENSLIGRTGSTIPVAGPRHPGKVIEKWTKNGEIWLTIEDSDAHGKTITRDIRLADFHFDPE